MKHSLDDSLSEQQLAQRKIFARHEKLQGLMLDANPALVAIKDVTHKPWTLVYMNEAMIDETAAEFEKYYNKQLGQIVDVDVEAFRLEDQRVIDGPFGISHEFTGVGLHGKRWRRERYKMADGDKLYVVLQMKWLNDG